MRRWSFTLLALVLSVCLTACGSTAGEDGGNQGGEEIPVPPAGGETVQLGQLALEIQGTESGGMEALQALEPLGSLLRKQLEQEGYAFESVQVTVGLSERATGEALAGGGVDAAILPAEGYVQYAWGLPVLLSSSPAAVDLSTGEGQITVAGASEAAPWRMGKICATGSDYGRTLSEEGNLTFDQVARASWAMEGGAEVRQWADLWLQQTFGSVSTADLASVETLEGRDALLMAAAMGEADLVFLIPGEIDGDGLTVIGEVGPICEQVLALGPGQEALQDPAFQAALGRAVADLFADEDGRQLLQRLGVEQPLMAADALDLDALRAAAQGREDAA